MSFGVLLRDENLKKEQKFEFEKPKFQIEHAVYLQEQEKLFLQSKEEMWEVSYGESKRVALEAGLSLLSSPVYFHETMQLQLVGEKEGVR